MYISKLHIHGFKSFLHKTDLNFGEGITSVIGPNGCGKSNIVDAIRWILGEQKTSVLRSKKMEDVIFNGSKNRKPLGFSEVSLTIHNDKGRLPVEYSDVEITRRLFRSGESEYLLNKVPCRLRDITELFMDTGMGADAYSVIELKMIDSILSHNPSERRRLFEEASGINQYRKQRQSATRKLDYTHGDLERVRDIIHEIEGKVHSLKLQLKRFERHKKLSKELKSSNVLLAQIEIQLIQEREAPQLINQSRLRSEQSNLSGQMNIDESLIQKVQDNYEIHKDKLDKSKNELLSLEKNLNVVNENILVWTEQQKSSESRIHQIKDEKSITENRSESLNTQIQELHQLIQDLKPEVNKRQNQYSDKKSDYQSIQDNYEIISQEYKKTKIKYDDQIQLIHNRENENQRKNATLEEKEKSLIQIQEKREGIISKRVFLESELIQLKEKIKLQEKENSKNSLVLETAQIDHAKIEEKVIEQKSNLIKIQSQIQSVKSKQQFYQEILQNHEGKSSGVKYVLDNPAKFKGVVGVVSDLLEVKDEYRHAVDIALGESSQYLVMDTRAHALSAIKILKNETKTKISIIPLDVIPKIKTSDNGKFKPVIHFIKTDKKGNSLFEYLLQQIYLIDSAEKYLELAEKQKNDYSWVTLNGDYFGQRYIIKSGRTNQESAIGRQKQVEKYEKDLQKLIQKEKSVVTQIQTLSDLANENHQNVKKLTNILNNDIKALHQLEKNFTQTEFVLNQNNDSIKDKKDQIFTIATLVDELKSGIGNLYAEIDRLKTEKLAFKTEIDAKSVSLNKLQTEKNALQQMVQDSRVSLVEIEKEIEGYEYRFKTANEQINELKERISRFDKERKNIDTKLDNLINYLEKAEAQKLVHLENQKLLTEKKNTNEELYNKYYDELQNLQKGVRDRQKIKDENIDRLQKTELKLAEFNTEKEIIRNKVRELYHVEVPKEVLDINALNPTELKQNIESIDRSIERIGPINMAVTEEYEKESERLAFLTSQNKDLVESEKIIRDTIKEIDHEAKNKFVTTFDAIAEHFKKTYTMIFDGGEAHLRLVHDDNPLEADIEVIARPPGKKTQTLRMLSGGEKALTAIALLFAIYLVKPSPFCILDEVDAPLDDINIRKFTNMLRKFSKETQFIVVTHNKLTMEASDYMYGVTQEEEGVSKIVSVEFS
jgi:chromosome segregation protein